MRASPTLAVWAAVAVSAIVSVSAEAQSQCGRRIRIYTDGATGTVKADPDPAPGPPSHHCRPGQNVVWYTDEGDLKIEFLNAQNPEPFGPPNCRPIGRCIGLVHQAGHPNPQRYKYVARICEGKDDCVGADPELVVAGGVLGPGGQEWVPSPETKGGGGEKDTDRFVIWLRVSGNNVIADPDTAVVAPGDVVEWRATKGSAKRIRFLDPDTRHYPQKDRNDKKLDEPKCSANKCTMTIPSGLTNYKPYTYVAIVGHEGKDKIADPELIVAGGEPPPPAVKK